MIAKGHSLKVFAYFDGDTVKGSVYFAGGIPAKKVKVLIETPDKQQIQLLKTDESGTFSSVSGMPLKVRVVADSLDGHRGTWVLERKENTERAIENVSQLKDDSIRPTLPVAQTTLNEDELHKVISKAVNQEIAPLRLELQKFQSEARLSDIIGGIGFIFGLAGILLWWRSRNA
jgi:nickel transport protein